MDAIGFFVALAALGLLAVHFWQDSRAGSRSKEHESAADGMTWDDLRHVPAEAAIRDVPTEERRADTELYPTLAFIERALGQGARILTASHGAAALEDRARALAATYWSDAVWTTGVVPAAAFRRILAELAPEVLVTGPDASIRAVSLEVGSRVLPEHTDTPTNRAAA
jgi:hypothetical protein